MTRQAAQTRTKVIVSSHVLAGAALGVFFLHPVTMAIVELKEGER